MLSFELLPQTLVTFQFQQLQVLRRVIATRATRAVSMLQKRKPGQRCSKSLFILKVSFGLKSAEVSSECVSQHSCWYLLQQARVHCRGLIEKHRESQPCPSPALAAGASKAADAELLDTTNSE